MRDMDRWLGDGGMPLLACLGARFDGYGVTAPGMGFSEAAWEPTSLSCNPRGTVQGGVHSVVLDAAMGFAVNAALDGGDRARASLEVKTETMRSAQAGDLLRIRGEVVRLARQVAFVEAQVRDAHSALVSRATATYLLHRDPAPAGGL